MSKYITIFLRRSLIVFLLPLFSAGVANAQLKFYEDEFHGGVTGAGWSVYDWSSNGGVKTVQVNIDPCSKIRKALLIAGRIGPLRKYPVGCVNNCRAQAIVMEGDTLIAAKINESTLFDSRAYGANSATHVFDVSHLVKPGQISYKFQRAGNIDFQDYYLYVAFESACLPMVRTAVFLNDHDMDAWFTYNNINFSKPTAANSDIGMSMIGGYMCGADGNDWETVAVNNDTIGKYVGGADGGSNAGCSGSKGDFFYKNNKLYGLDNDIPDLAMQGGDALSNISSIISPGTTSLQVSFSQGCCCGVPTAKEGCISVNGTDTTYGTQSLDNYIWGLIFAYGTGEFAKSDLDAGPDQTICAGQSVYLNPKGGVNYKWEPDPTLSCTDCANPIASPIKTTTYVVSTGNSCCTITDTVTVTVSGSQINVHPPIIACGPVKESLIVTQYPAGSDYKWSTGETTDSIVVTDAGTYWVDVAISNCNATDTFHVIKKPGPDVQLDKVDLSCTGPGNNGKITTIVNHGTPPYTYSWSNGITTASMGGLTKGSYSLTITDANGCELTRTVEVKDLNEEIIAVVTVLDHADCQGVTGRAVVNSGGGTAPYTYFWSGPVNRTDRIANDLPPGNYKVTVTDSKGCSKTTATTITSAGDLELDSLVTYSDACDRQGGVTAEAVIQAKGSGPFIYQWNDSQKQVTDTANGLASGTYTVIVTDAKGCKDSLEVVVEEKIQIDINIDVEPTCATCSDGQVSATIGGFGKPPYTYRWDDENQQTTLTASGLKPGTYKVTVTDDDDCRGEAVVTIGGPKGIEEATQSRLNIYPIPGDGYFTLSLPVDRVETCLLMIYDARGRQVFRKNYNNATPTIRFDISNNPEGIYLLKLISDNQVLFSKIQLVK